MNNRMTFMVIGIVMTVLGDANASEVVVPLDGYHLTYPLTVDAGDVVTWQTVNPQTNFVAEYAGEWTSPPLTNMGATFSMTFGQAGFFAYRTAVLPGGVIVLPWTNSPPAVSINYPADGFHFAGTSKTIRIDTTVRIAASNVAKVDLVTNGVLLATITQAPYSFTWTNAPGGIARVPYSISAIATDRGGNTYSSRPVAIDIGWSTQVSLAHMLGDGSFMCYYSTMVPGTPQWTCYLTMYTDLPPTPAWGWRTVSLATGDSLFVDSSAPLRRQQFYRVEGFVIPPP